MDELKYIINKKKNIIIKNTIYYLILKKYKIPIDIFKYIKDYITKKQNKIKYF